jgi:hypothetical protein
MKRIVAMAMTVLVAAVGIIAVTPSLSAEAASISYCPTRHGMTLVKYSLFHRNVSGKTLPGAHVCIFKDTSAGTVRYKFYADAKRGVTAGWAFRDAKNDETVLATGWRGNGGPSFHGTISKMAGVTHTDMGFRVKVDGIWYYSLDFHQPI